LQDTDDGQQQVHFVDLKSDKPIQAPARAFNIFDGWHFLELCAALEAAHGPVTISYRDDEDDLVSIKTHEELLLAVQLVNQPGAPIGSLALLIGPSRMQSTRGDHECKDVAAVEHADEDPEHQYCGATALFAHNGRIATALFAQVDESGTETQDSDDEEFDIGKPQDSEASDDGEQDYVGATAMLGDNASEHDESEIDERDWEVWLEGLEGGENSDGTSANPGRGNGENAAGAQEEGNEYVGGTAMFPRGLCEEDSSAPTKRRSSSTKAHGAVHGGGARGRGSVAGHGVAKGGVRRSSTKVKGDR
jgi:hypothetical protein